MNTLSDLAFAALGFGVIVGASFAGLMVAAWRRHAHEDAIYKEELAEAREKYTCECVKLNSDIGVYNMQRQEERMRVGLKLGLVSMSLSAWKPCPHCGGTGVPKKGALCL